MVARGLGSVAVAWTAWILGQVLVGWKGLEYMRFSTVRDDWSAQAFVALLVLLAGALVLALSTTSLALSWVGLLTLGVAQTVAALLFGFFWNRGELLSAQPEFLRSGLYGYHQYLGVHLVLGALLTGLAVAALVRSRGGSRGAVARVLSLGAFPLLAVAVVLFVHGSSRNSRTVQILGDVDPLAVVLLLAAAGAFAAVGLVGAASGIGPGTAGALLTLLALVMTAFPGEFVARAGGQFMFSLLNLSVTGGLLIVSLVLAVGSAMVSLSARTTPKKAPAPADPAWGPGGH